MDVLHIYRAAALTAAIGAHHALHSDSLLAQTRASITATAVISASTTSLPSLEHAALLVNRAVQQPASLTTPASCRHEIRLSTITVQVAPPDDSPATPSQATQTELSEPGETPPPSRSVMGEKGSLLVTIAFTAN